MASSACLLSKGRFLQGADMRLGLPAYNGQRSTDERTGSASRGRSARRRLCGEAEWQAGRDRQVASTRRLALQVVRAQYDDLWAGLRRAYCTSVAWVDAYAGGALGWTLHLEDEQVWAADLRNEMRRIVHIRASLPFARESRALAPEEIEHLAWQQEARSRFLDRELPYR